MSITTDTKAQGIQQLVDREDITRLAHRLGVILDEQAFDDIREVFAEDASVTTPGGHAQGIDKIVAQASRNHRPGLRTQHLMTNVVVDVDGDEATVRGNYVGIFTVSDDAPPAPGDPVVSPAPQFQIGSVYRFGARRTADGWRLTSMSMHPVWEVGERP